MTDANDGRQVYATHYRIRWSTDPDASDWNLLDDFGWRVGQRWSPVAGATGKCTYSHGAGIWREYTYEVFANAMPLTVGYPVNDPSV